MAHSRWNTEALWQQLVLLLPGLSIEVVARSESTNTQLLERARLHQSRGGGYGRRAGDTQPCLLVAEHQTAGRGRLGRSWKSAPDASLTFSLALPLASTDWSGLSLAVGVALAEALDAQPARLKLKWPNDLLLADDGGALRKLGGVLIESVAVGAHRMAVIGVGINVRPYEYGDLPAGFGCLQELFADVDPPQALARLALPLVRALSDFDREGGFAPFAARYAAHDALRGRRVEVTPGAVAGIADGVAADGALRLIDDDGALQLVTSGELSVRLAR